MNIIPDQPPTSPYHLSVPDTPPLAKINISQTSTNQAIKTITNLSGSKVNSAFLMEQSEVREVNTRVNFSDHFKREVQNKQQHIVIEDDKNPKGLQINHEEEITSLRQRIRYLQQQLNEVGKLVGESRSYSERSESVSPEIVTALKDENVMLLSLLKDKQQQIQQLKILMAEVAPQDNDSGKYLHDLQQNYQQSRIDRVVSSSRSRSSKKSNIQLQQDIIILNQQIKQMLDKLEAMNIDYEEIKKMNIEMMDKISDMTRENQELTRDNQQLTRDNQQLTRLKKQLEIKINSLFQSTKNLQTNNQEIETLKKVNRQLKQQIIKHKENEKIISQDLLTHKMILQENNHYYQNLIAFYKEKGNDDTSELSLEDRHHSPECNCPLKTTKIEELGSLSLYNQYQERQRQTLQKRHKQQLADLQAKWLIKLKEKTTLIQNHKKQLYSLKSQVQEYERSVDKLKDENSRLTSWVSSSQSTNNTYKQDYIRIHKILLTKEMQYRHELQNISDELQKAKIQCQYHKNNLHKLMQRIDDDPPMNNQVQEQLNRLKMQLKGIVSQKQKIQAINQELSQDKKKLSDITELLLQKYEQLSNNCTCSIQNNTSRSDRSFRSGLSVRQQQYGSERHRNFSKKLQILKVIRQQLEDVHE